MLPKAANMELLETRNIRIAGLAFDLSFAAKVPQAYQTSRGMSTGRKTPLGAPLVPRSPRPCRRASPLAGPSRELRRQAPHQEDMPQQQRLPPLASDTIPAGVYTTSRE